MRWGVTARRVWCGLSAEVSALCRPDFWRICGFPASRPAPCRRLACGRLLAHLSPIQPGSQLHFRVPGADLFPLLLERAHHILPPTHSSSPQSLRSLSPHATSWPPSPPLSSHSLPSGCLPASLRWKPCQRRLSQTESSASLSSSWHHNIAE